MLRSPRNTLLLGYFILELHSRPLRDHIDCEAVCDHTKRGSVSAASFSLPLFSRVSTRKLLPGGNARDAVASETTSETHMRPRQISPS